MREMKPLPDEKLLIYSVINSSICESTRTVEVNCKDQGSIKIFLATLKVYIARSIFLDISSVDLRRPTRSILNFFPPRIFYD